MPEPCTDPARKSWFFLAFFVLAGLGFMTPFVLQAIRDYRIARVYQQTECTVVDERQVMSSSTSNLGGHWIESHHSHREFIWRYTVNGHNYSAQGYDNHDGIITDPQETGNISKGITQPCWYDPADPEKSVLARRFRAKFYLGALIPGSFILIGGMMLAGVLRRRPKSSDVRLSQGERLAVRLSPFLSTRGVMGCLGVLILLLGVIIVLVLQHLNDGEVTFLLFGGGIEAFLIHHFIRAVRAARLPDPIVEINNEPLKPGQATELYIRHPGPARLSLLEVRLVCEKTGQRGERLVHDEMLHERGELHITDVEEFNGSFTVPAKASPSRKTAQSVTNWFIRIRRRLNSNVSYDTDYTFRVAARNDREEVDL